MDDFICDVQCDETQAYYDWLQMQELEKNLFNMIEEDWVDVFDNEEYPEENIEDMPF
jgi:hypothetical protein